MEIALILKKDIGYFQSRQPLVVDPHGHYASVIGADSDPIIFMKITLSTNILTLRLNPSVHFTASSVSGQELRRHIFFVVEILRWINQGLKSSSFWLFNPTQCILKITKHTYIKLECLFSVLSRSVLSFNCDNCNRNKIY